MATLTNVSSKLQTFMDEIYPNKSKYISDASNFNTSVSTSLTKYQDTLSDVSSSWTDSDSAVTKAVLELIINACNNIKTSIDNDLSTAINDFDKVKEVYDKAKKLHDDNTGLKPGEEVDVGTWFEFIDGWFDGKKYEKNDDDKIKKVNQDIELANKQGEALIDAIRAGLDGVNLGIVGNMKRGGSLGPVTNYSSLNVEAVVGAINLPDEQTDSQPLNFWQELGCGVVGAVESTVKVFEGAADFVLTLGAGAVSLITGNDDNQLREWAEYDFARNTVGKVGELIAGSAEAYDNSVGRKVGDTIGTAVTHGALWVTGPGAIISALSVAGSASEDLLKDDKTVGEALWKGAALGGLSYAGGKIIGAVTNKIAPALSGWIQNSSNIVARTLKAATTSFKNIGSLSLGGKIVNVVTSPLRGAANVFNKMVNAEAKVLGKVINHLPGHTLLQKADTGATKIAQQLVDGVSNKVSIALNSKAVKKYNTALQNWEANGKQINTPEYEEAQKAWNKLGSKKPANFGDAAYTTQDIDARILRYQQADNELRTLMNSSNPNPADVASKQAARQAAFDNIPQSARPATVGDAAFTTADRNAMGDLYNQARTEWINSGRGTNTPQYNKMKTGYDFLPDDMKVGINVGDSVITPHASDVLMADYNGKVATFQANPTPANRALAENAYNALPVGNKPATFGEVAMNSLNYNSNVNAYNNKIATFIGNGSHVNTAEYTALEAAHNALPKSIKTPNIGDKLGTFIPTAPTRAGQIGGALTSEFISENAN